MIFPYIWLCLGFLYISNDDFLFVLLLLRLLKWQQNQCTFSYFYQFAAKHKFPTEFTPLSRWSRSVNLVACQNANTWREKWDIFFGAETKRARARYRLPKITTLHWCRAEPNSRHKNQNKRETIIVLSHSTHVRVR